ncbi:hypothetical protein CRUP_032093 [Coryphaenoides rupestris]|nr:hypothetical protein CRUP_032093 [Coryphaenoides rupestris]
MCRGLDSLPITCLERVKQLKSLFASLRHKQQDASVGIMGHSNKTDTQRLNRREPLNWNESFEKLLSSQNGLCFFRAFLQSEFSEENIAFYLACEDYKASKDSELPAKAQKIYQEFLSTDAPREVNLDHLTKALTLEGLQQAGPGCFDSEFSEENIAFYLACEDYKASKDSELPAKAQKIYQEFLSTDAPREVNLDHLTKALTLEGLQQAGPGCFDVAQANIHMLMKKDCYPRFLQSPAYLELLRGAKKTG